MEKRPIYLDYNASTPLLPEVLEVLINSSRIFANPSSGHILGVEAREILAHARKAFAENLKCSPEEIIFTSGGTEANHLALFGVCSLFTSGHLLVSAFEHPSVLKPAKRLAEIGFEVELIPVTQEGYVEPDEVKSRIKKDTRLVSIMLANNEIGTLQPIEEISKICKEREIPLHTDACQALGKVEIDFQKLGADLLSIAGHKAYAPKGIGALIVRKDLRLSPLFLGGGQERGLRAGTEPLPLITAFSKAIEILKKDLPAETERLLYLREYLYNNLKELYPRLYRFGIPERTLPNTLTVSFVGLDARELLRDLPWLCASTGSACHDRKSSTTLQALLVSPEIANGTIRFSLGRFTTLEDLELAIDGFKEVLRNFQP